MKNRSVRMKRRGSMLKVGKKSNACFGVDSYDVMLDTAKRLYDEEIMSSKAKVSK